MEHVPDVFSGCAAAGIPVRACKRAIPDSAPPDRAAWCPPRRVSDSTAAGPARRDVSPCVGKCDSLVDRGPCHLARRTVSRPVGHGSAASAMAGFVGPTGQESIRPLRSQQCGKLPRAAVLSAAPRADLPLEPAGNVVDGRIHRCGNPHRGLRPRDLEATSGFSHSRRC